MIAMAPTTTAINKSSFPPPPPPCSDVVMGRWRSSLSSGLRAALACTIVGLFSLYAPPALRRHITFPAFSYVVTVITIAPDATLGTALRGAVSAFHGTLMGAAPSVAALWLAHRTESSSSVTATSAVVALTAFAVALPEEDAVGGPLAKRVALGQAIIIYVARFSQQQQGGLVALLLHPANVVACTAVGVAAALLAVLLPWPRMATREARDKSRVAFKVLAAERVRVLADAFIIGDSEACCRQRRWQMAACISEANRLASASTTLVKRINALKEDLQWERVVVDDNDQKQSSIEMALAGMQIALETMQQQADGGHGRNDNNNMENMAALVMATRDQIRLALLTPNKQSRSSFLFGFGSTCSSSTATAMPSNISLYQLPTLTDYDHHEQQQQQLAHLLFIFSLYQLHRRCCGAGPDDEMALTAAAASIPNAKQVAPATTTTTGPELLPFEQPTADLFPADDDHEQEKGVDQQVGQDDDDPSPQQGQTATVTAGEKEKATTTGTNKHPRGCISWWPPRRRLVAAAKCGFSLGLAVLLGLLFSNDHGFWSGLIVATTMSAGRESTWAVAVARAHGTALGSIYGVLGCLLMSRQEQLLTMDLRFLALQLPWMVVAAFLRRSRAYGPAGGVAAALSVVIIMGRRYDEAPMAFTMARLVETFIGISCAVLADLLFQPGARPTVQAREQLNRCIAALADCCCNVVAEASSSDSELKRVQQELALLRKRVTEAGGEPTYLWLPPFPAACYDKIQGSLGRMAQLLQLYDQARRCISVDTNTNTIQQQRFSSLVSNSLSHCLHMLAPPGKEEAKKPKRQVLDLEAGGVGCSCCYKADESFRAHEGESKLSLLNDDNDNVQQQEENFLVMCCLGSIALCMGEILKEAQRLEAHIIDLNNLQLSTH